MKKKTTTRKKPAASPIPPPPPGWEIVDKDDPRLDCLPDALRYLVDERWVLSRYGAGESLPEPHRKSKTYALPIVTPTQSAAPQPALASPPMIRLRLPSEKPTADDADDNSCIAVIWKNGQYDVRGWDWPFHPNIRAWLGRLSDGILPREPTQEEKWRAEFEEWAVLERRAFMKKRPNGEYSSEATREAWYAFLAAKKGGAE
jgi:hypothetical protein